MSQLSGFIKIYLNPENINTKPGLYSNNILSKSKYT